MKNFSEKIYKFK